MFDLEEFPVDFWDVVALVSSFVIVVGSPKIEADLELEKNPIKINVFLSETVVEIDFHFSKIFLRKL